MGMTWEHVPQALAISAVFTVFGVAIFGAAFWVMAKVCPFSIRKEIEEDQNVALAIIMSSVIIGIAIIVAVSML
jgi:uncharacterized membrane protein YjfL (UPF0719 family)